VCVCVCYKERERGKGKGRERERYAVYMQNECHNLLVWNLKLSDCNAYLISDDAF